MLEDALRRESGALGARDVGWRRSRTGTAPERPTSRQGQHRTSMQESVVEEPRRSAGSRRGSTASTASGAGSPAVASAPTSPAARPAVSPVIPAPPASSGLDNRRFFGFRFGGSGAATPNPNANGSSSRPQTPPLRKPSDTVRDRERDTSHLTSASLPSLVQAQAPPPNECDEEITAALEAERTKCAKALAAKAELEKELESLSQALFEEVNSHFPRLYWTSISDKLLQANKMVAHERIKRAEAEEELQAQLAEKQALQSAMRIVEQENRRLRAPSRPPPDSLGNEDNNTRDSSPVLERKSEPDRPSRSASRTSAMHESRGRASSPEPIDSRPRAQSAVRASRPGHLTARAGSSASASTRSQSLSRSGLDEVSGPHKNNDSVSSTRAFRTRSRSRSGSRSSCASGSVVSSSVLSAMPVEESPWAH